MIKNFLIRIYLKTFQAKKIEFENNVTDLINYDNLEPMYAELKKSPEIYHPSNLWYKISKMHEKRDFIKLSFGLIYFCIRSFLEKFLLPNEYFKIYRPLPNPLGDH